jgi:hypothetical protein
VISTLKEAARKTAAFLPDFFARLTFRRDSGPLDGGDALCRFVSTRAAFTAQRTLYGYLKTRMGIRYPRMFEEDAIISSINIAKMHVFAACLSDLTIFAVSLALEGSGADAEAHRALAKRCYSAGLGDNAAAAEGLEAFSISAAQTAFEQRLASWDWHGGPRGPEIFTESPAALYRWAPIAPDLKKLDKEIVENSIRFTWRNVRRNFEKRVVAAAIAAEVAGRRPEDLQPAGA